MSTVRIRDLPNLGEKSEAMLAEVGIATVGQLLDRDPVEVWLRVRAAVPGTSLNLLYALVGAIDQRPWQQVRREDKLTLLLRAEQAQYRLAASRVD